MQNMIPNERSEECFKAAVLTYMGTLLLHAHGVTALKKVLFIPDCFRYSSCVRTYIHLGKRRRSVDKNKSLTSNGAEHGNRRVVKK